MKIAMITRYLPPRPDGVGDYTIHLAKALAQIGEETMVITEAGQVVSTSGAAVPVKPVIRNWGLAGVLCLLRAMLELRVDRINLQYVPHMYGPWGINFFVASIPFLVRFLMKKPVITTCHELLSHKPSALRAWVLQPIYLLQAWLILAGSTDVIVPVTWQEKQLHRYFPRLSRKVHRIPAGNNIPVFNRLKLEAQSPLSGATPLTIGTFGTGPWWQHGMAIGTLRALRDRGINARLLCLGDIEGRYPHYYQKLRQVESHLDLSGFIDWTGYVSYEDASRLLQKIDLFLALHEAGVTSRNTGFLAAMAHGLPMVITSGPDADDWILKSHAAAVVDPHNLPQVIDEVAALLSDHDRRVQLGKNALDFYTRHFSWDMIRESFLQISSCNQTAATG